MAVGPRTVQYLPVGPSGPVQDPAVIGNFFVLCLFFIEFSERLLRSAMENTMNNPSEEMYIHRA